MADLDPKFQLPQITFAGGIDESIRPEAVDPSSAFTVVENVRQTQRGGFDKRCGRTLLPSYNNLDGVARTVGGKLLNDGGSCVVCALDPTAGVLFQSYSEALQASVNLGGKVPDCDVKLHPVAMPGASTSTPSFESVAYANGYVCGAWTGGQATPSIYAALFDGTDWGTVLGPDNPHGVQGFDVLVAGYGVYLFLVVANGASHTVTYQILDTTSATSINAGWSTATTLVSDFSGSLAVDSLSDRIVIAYVSTSSKTVGIAYVQWAATATATISTTTNSPTHVDIAATAAALFVCWNDGTNMFVGGYDPTALTVVYAAVGLGTVAAGAGAMILCAPATLSGYLVVNWSATLPCAMTVFAWHMVSTAVTVQGSAVVYNANACSRAINVNERVFLHAFSGDYSGQSTPALQQQVVLVDVTAPLNNFLRPVACPTFNLSVPSQYFSTVLGHAGTKPSLVYDAATATYLCPLGVKQSGVANASVILEYNFAGAQRWKSVSHNGATYLTGGILAYSDGDRVAEAGFLFRPPKPTITTGGTGITMSTGRSYVLIYEEVDALGNWCVSGISDPVSSGAVSNKTISVACTPLTITGRINVAPSGNVVTGTRIALYATTDGNLPPYYRLGVVANNTTSATTTYADITSDATLATKAVLYSPDLPSYVGGSLDRRAPCGMAHIASYNGMLVGALGQVLYWSGQPVTGEATWFSPVFQQPVMGHGDITGLAVQDGSLFVFFDDEVHGVSGDIPADNGSAGGLGTPRRLAASTGCIDGRSICRTATGIFFQSRRGIELLSRSQDVSWIGEQVRMTTASFPVCVAATLDYASERVYFEMVDSGPTYGRCLVYNLTLQAWESIDRRTNVNGLLDLPAVSAAMIVLSGVPRYAHITPYGDVYYEDPTTYLDARSYWVTKRVHSAWIKSGGLQGQQLVNRVLLLGQGTDAADILCTFANDYNSGFGTAQTKTADVIASLPTYNLQLEFRPDANDVTQATRVQLVDATPTNVSVGTGQGPLWIGLLFEVAPQVGGYQLPDAAR